MLGIPKPDAQPPFDFSDFSETSASQTLKMPSNHRHFVRSAMDNVAR